MAHARTFYRSLKSRWIVASLAACTIGSVGYAAATNATPMVDADLNLCAMTLSFADEFDTMSIASRDGRTAKWTAHTPWNGDFGDAVFLDPGPNGPFAVKDGILSITAKKDAKGRWTSGLISAADGKTNGFSQRYGYFEARMKLPKGPGLWSAFWLGTNEPRGRMDPSVEVDVIEHYGHAPKAYSSVLHIWSKNPVRDQATPFETAVPDGSLYDSYHFYGVKVTPSFITFYLDRKPTWQVKTPAALQLPLFPLVNLAMGSGFPIDKTPNPSVLLVDYVRAYAFNPDGSAADCP